MVYMINELTNLLFVAHGVYSLHGAHNVYCLQDVHRACAVYDVYVVHCV